MFMLLLDPEDTLYFVTPLIARKFDILPDISNEPFVVTTPLGETVVTKRVYRNCPIILSNRISFVELVELDIVDLMLYWECIGFMIAFLP